MGKCVFIALAIAIFIGQAGCVGQQGEGIASLGKPFTLALGQNVSIKGEDLNIKFLEVTADSRCPKGATCIWQGEVTGRVEVSHSKAVRIISLTQPGLTQEYAKAESDGYVFQFDMQPYPELGKEIKRDDYRLHLVIDSK